MESRKTFIPKHLIPAKRAFTLIEVMVVIGLFFIVGGLGLLISMDSYRSSSFYADRNLLVATLQRARAEAIHNVCLGTCTGINNDGKAHGVHILSDKYVIFQGTAYSSSDPLNAEFSANPGFVHGGLTDVLFTQLSGTTTNTGDIVLSDKAGHVSTTTIGSEGQISWTH